MRRVLLLTALADWLPKLASFLALFLVARSLGAAGFGLYAVALGWIGYAWWAVDLGQSGYAVRTLAGRPRDVEQRLGSEIFSLFLALALLVTAGLVGLLLLTGHAGTPQGRLLLAMSPYLVAYALVPDWWLRATGRLGGVALANWTSVLALLGAWALLPRGSATGYALAYGLAPAAGALVAWSALRRHGVRAHLVLSWTAWRSHLRVSLLFAAAGAGGQLATPLALAVMAGRDAAAAGAFALGLRASGAASNALWILLQNALPRIMAKVPRLPALALLAVTVPPLLGLAVAALLWGPLLLPAVGASYAGLGLMIALGVLLLAAAAPKYLVEIALIARGADRTRVAMNAAAPVVVLLALLLGPEQAWVMPVALLAGELTSTAVGHARVRVLERRAGTEALQPVG